MFEEIHKTKAVFFILDLQLRDAFSILISEKIKTWKMLLWSFFFLNKFLFPNTWGGDLNGGMK